MLSRACFSIAILTLAGSAAVTARASQLYRITGEIVGFTASTISIRRGTDVFEFVRSKHLGLLSKGERITILYHLAATQISPAPEAPGIVPDAPGIAPDAPREGPLPRSSPGVIDDRAFYNAKNQPHPTRKDPS